MTQTMLRSVRSTVTALGLVAATAALAIQPTSDSPLAPRPNGPRSAEPTHHAMVGATIHTAPGQTIEAGTVVFKDGRLTRVARGANAPSDAMTHDAAGLHIYPAFIDAFVSIDTPRADGSDPGAHWNPYVTPRRSPLAGDGLPESAAKKHREMGFAAAALAPDGGIFRGQGVVVSLGEEPDDASARYEAIYRNPAFHAMGFDTFSWGQRQYPNSRLGVVALMRQTFIDADWQAQNNDGPANAITPLESKDHRFFYDLRTDREAVLAINVHEEFGRIAVLVGSGESYRYADAIAKSGFPVITPMTFPRQPDVATPGEAESVSLGALVAWEQAPTNARRLLAAGVDVAITATKLRSGEKFHDNLRKAIKHGLSEPDALAALTTTPAELLGVSDQLGTLERGKRANFIVADGPIFEKDTKILDVWIDGVRHRVNDHEGHDFDGEWRMIVGSPDNPVYEQGLTIEGSTTGKPKLTNRENWNDDEVAENQARKVAINGRTISFLVDDEDDGTGVYQMSGTLMPDGRIYGQAINPDQSSFQWTGIRRDNDAASDEAESVEEASDSDDGSPDIPETLGFPIGGYSMTETPEQRPVLIMNAKIWTSGPRGIIENGWLFAIDGKVLSIGEMPANGDRPRVPQLNNITVVDAEGKHVTPGLIDAHSHSGLFEFGVNEGGQAVTSEVRIGDSLDPSNITFYRQLAAGVTSALLLHGSANPIGGQSQTVKFRWGSQNPTDMFLEGKKSGIKFALGENVKQSRGQWPTSRYPRSRMGVEAIIRDRFIAAQEYAADQNARRDLELEALAEILAGERLVHCHSYRQDEILMLCRVAEDFGFKIGSFQHGLEVYKVAEAVKEHALGASIFSDWWVFKIEVGDAIPFAGPLQTEAGVLTSFNSDSDNLARRMNIEAAKAVKYSRKDANGDPIITPAEALKFVTINPAIQLGIDNRVGSLEQGKDADFVVWSGDPLSTLSVPEHVFIDGREYFSLEQDRAHRERNTAERKRIIQKILANPKKKEAEKDDGEEGGASDAPSARESILARYYLRRLDNDGLHPGDMKPGECGCMVLDHDLYFEMLQLNK